MENNKMEWVRAKVDPERLYTPIEVANLLGFTKEYIYKNMRAGRLNGFKVASRWKIPGEEVLRFLTSLIKDKKEEA